MWVKCSSSCSVQKEVMGITTMPLNISNICLPSPKTKPISGIAGMCSNPSIKVQSVASASIRKRSLFKPATVWVHQCLTPTRESFHVKKSEHLTVHPVTQTYNGLYYLSKIDQNLILPLEMVYGYTSDGIKGTDNAYEVFKKSLAEILVHFYPLAGRLKMSSDGKNFMVKCSGQGVHFVEAIADIELDEFGDISTPNAAKLRQLVHVPEEKDMFDRPLLTVQVTMFKCGGFVLGLVMNHCMMDGMSLNQFMNSWAEIARGLPLSLPPFLDRSILKGKVNQQLPQIPLPNQIFYSLGDLAKATNVYHREPVVYKSVQLNHEKMMKLKKTVVEEGGFTVMPSNSDLITAYMWRAMVRSCIVGAPKHTTVLIPVNARMLLGRSFPKGYSGNCLGVACVDCNTEELMEIPLGLIAEQVHKATKRVTKDYLHSSLDFAEAMDVLISYDNAFCFSNLTRIPIYKVDFGWGDAKKVGFVTLPKNTSFILPQPNADRKNIYAVVGLPPAAMEIFQESMI